MGKGDSRRPQQVTKEEENLRWLLFQKKISFEDYKRKRKKLIEQGLWGQRKIRFR